MHVYEYAKALNYKATQEYPICCAMYSAKNMEIYLGAHKSVTIWSLKQGVQIRSMLNIMKGEITGLALDEGHRKLFVSDQRGCIK